MRIINVTLFLLFFSLLTGWSMPAFSQDMKVSLNLKNASLQQVFAEIEKQNDVVFIYKQELIDKANKVSIVCEKANLNEILKSILAKSQLNYIVKGRQIVITAATPVAQVEIPSDIKITGKVTDGDNNPLPGTAILIKGTHKGTMADVNGQFSIEVPKNTILVFSFLGMKTKEIVCQSQANISVMMEDQAKEIGGVMVTGYQAIEKGRATGSYEVVSSKQASMVVSNDIVDKLEGIVPGLMVNSNGDMMIRGQATIYSQTKPLVVVDGFPMEYDTYNINPNDIEQITVLKDAASASIWGVRAANGVIVITTKKGKKNEKTTVSYSGNVKIGSKFDVSSLGYLNSEQQIEWEREKFANYPSSINNIGPTSYSYYSEAAWIEYQYKKGLLSSTEREAAFTQLGSYDNDNEIEKYFYRNSLMQIHNIVIAGGSETLTNYFSMNYENTLGDLIGNDRNSLGVQLNNTFDLSKRLKLSTGFRANYSGRDTYSGTPTQMLPYIRIKDGNGDYINEYNGTSQLQKDNMDAKGYSDWNYNRLQDRPLTDNKTTSHNVAANVQLDFDIIKGLRFTTTGAYIIDHSKQELLYGKNSYYVRNMFNRFTSYANGILTNNFPEGAIKNITQNNSTSYTFRNTLNYNFNKDLFSLSAMAGTEIFAIRAKTETDTFYGYDPQGMSYNPILNFYDMVNTGIAGYSGAKEKLSYSPSQSDTEDRYFSTFFTASASYDNRYTFFGSIRYDKTNLYGRSSKYRDQPTWSAGLKWNIFKESFFHASKIDQLALKLSYGLSGNVNKSTSPYLIAANARDSYLSLPVLIIRNPANDKLSWEKVYTFNAGIESGLFDNRLNISADYYIRNTHDALGTLVMDPTTGWSSVMKNTASLKNTGLDLSISGRPVWGKNLNWTSTVTFSYNYNEVTEVNAGEETVAMVTSGNPLKGKPVDYVYAYRNGGLSSDGKLQVLDAAGDIHLYNQVGGFVPEDLLIMGRRSPKYFGAWTNMFSYKGFELDILISYKLGYMIRMPSIGNADTDRRPYKTFNERWRRAGDEEKTWIPAANYQVTGQYIDAINANEKMTEKGDLIKLKSIGLSYDFKRIVNIKSLSALNLKFSVENPWFWTANSQGIDPDRLSGSSITFAGDMPAYYTFTLNIKF